MAASAIFLFAPKFRELGADVALKWAERQAGTAVIHGICTGEKEVVARVRARLGAHCGELHYLPDLEAGWMKQQSDAKKIKAFNETYPPGTLGWTITADRRVGRGFVTDGTPRPDLLGAAILNGDAHVAERYVLGLYEWLEEIFNRAAPDLVFCYAVAGAAGLALAIVSQKRNACFLKITPARVGSRMIIDASTKGNIARVDRRYAIGAEASSDGLLQARAHLENFRNRPVQPEYQQRLMANRAARRPVREIAMSGLYAARSAVPGYLAGVRHRRETAQRHAANAKAMVREMLTSRLQFAELKELNRPFIFFPLHVSPEASTMVLTPALTDQFAIAGALAKSLPAGVDLVIKEHAPMLGLRPAQFYERLLRLPGVRLADPHVSGLALVQNAVLTVVITGTAAWEAVLLGRPALVLGGAPYSVLNGGAVFHTDFTSLPSAVSRAIAEPAVAEPDLERFLGILFDISFELPSEAIWGDYLSLSDEHCKNVSATLADEIITAFHELTDVEHA